MRDTITETAPRTGSLRSERYRSGFDSILPPEALDEMLRRSPQRRRHVEKTSKHRHVPSWLKPTLALVGMMLTPILAVAAIGALMIVLTSYIVEKPAPPTAAVPSPTPAPRQPQAPAIAFLPAVQTPVVVPTSPIVEVRRAEPAPVTVKRATLMRLPSQEIGVYKWYELPESVGGGMVWGRFCGTVGRFSQIPPNPTPGDLWNVTETAASWIYCTPLGQNHFMWVDP